MEKQHHPKKNDSQVDRIVFFSDAVFAIAITLLVIDLKVPKIEGAISDHNFLVALANEIPQLGGFILSFFIIGLYWSVHHSIFGFVVNYSKKLVWLNLVFLFTIALMPFSTAVYSEYSFSEKYFNLLGPFGVYVFNIVMIGTMNFVLLKYIFNPKNDIAESFTENYAKFRKIRSFAVPAVFTIALLVGFINAIFGRYLLFLIPFVMTFLGRLERSQMKKAALKDNFPKL
jgi:uncharacterized membrane protein